MVNVIITAMLFCLAQSSTFMVASPISCRAVICDEKNVEARIRSSCPLLNSDCLSSIGFACFDTPIGVQCLTVVENELSSGVRQNIVGRVRVKPTEGTVDFIQMPDDA